MKLASSFIAWFTMLLPFVKLFISINRHPCNAIAIYLRRWEIETLRLVCVGRIELVNGEQRKNLFDLADIVIAYVRKIVSFV
jgi:hypothetical protein